MTIFFATFALAIITALAYTVHRQYHSRQAMDRYCLYLAEEAQGLRRQLNAIVDVIEHRGGGVEKRISEQQEILAAITTRQPVLFKDESGLKHWLNAHSEFFGALKSAVASERRKN